MIRTIIEKDEYLIILRKLKSLGFTSEEVNLIDNLFWGESKEKGKYVPIDGNDVKRGIEELKKYLDKYKISEDKIDSLEKTLRKYL